MIAYAVAAALWAASLAGTAYWFYGAGRDTEIATQAREDAAATKAANVAAAAAAEAISKIKVQHRTVQQEVQREVLEKPVYVACRHSERQLQHINAALTGADAEPAGRGLVPPADAADGLKFRGDNDQAGGSGRDLP